MSYLRLLKHFQKRHFGVEGLVFGVAHGKAFEDNCLKALFKYYHIRHPKYQIYCTHRASEILFPELENHKLQTVTAHCGYDLCQALADAEECAVTAMKMFKKFEIWTRRPEFFRPLPTRS